jgi:endogenous inhibitor of DNA gyrase (YacG/DUF329 family)
MSDARLCVYCRLRPREAAFRPFCSERCKMADLGRWLSGDYRVPIRQDDENDLSQAPGVSAEDPDPS